jgi:hypothetical protein
MERFRVVVPPLPRRAYPPVVKTAFTGSFLKGPIAMGWLTAAGKLPGRSLHVAIVVQHLAGMLGGGLFRLESKHLRAMGVDRSAEYRALRGLERAGLVAVVRVRGRRPLVSLRSLPGTSSSDAAPMVLATKRMWGTPAGSPASTIVQRCAATARQRRSIATPTSASAEDK